MRRGRETRRRFLPRLSRGAPFKERQLVQKRGKERGRSWLNSGPWFALFLVIACGFYWLVNREPSGVSLTYGQFKQILQDPSVRFQDVKVGRTEIRGKITTRDSVSDGEQNEHYGVTSSFHT